MAKPPRKPSGPSRTSLRAPSARDRFTIRPRKSAGDDAAPEDKPRRPADIGRATLAPRAGGDGKAPRGEAKAPRGEDRGAERPARGGKPAHRGAARPGRPDAERGDFRSGKPFVDRRDARPNRDRGEAVAHRAAESARPAKPYADRGDARPARPYVDYRAEKAEAAPKRFGDRTRARVEAQAAARAGKPYGDRNEARPAKTYGQRPYATRPAGAADRDEGPARADARAPAERFGHREPRSAPAERTPRRPAPTARIPAEPAPRLAPHVEGAAERICKLLARAGVASRRDSEKLIAEGRVSLNGEVVTTPATILTSLKGVTVDDAPVSAPEATRLFAFHKPDGLITAARDPAGRPTIYSALRNALPPGAPRVMPIGRLDFSTEGLLLLTNDGEFKRLLELPSTGVPRTYRARTFGDVSQAQLETLIEGVEIDGFRYGKVDANLERRTGRNQWVEVTLTEGKNREVRRVLEYLGLEVSRLIRTSYGPFPLGDLRRGAAYEIPQDAIERFAKTLKPKTFKKPDPAA